MRVPDSIGLAGKVWHLKRCRKREKQGNIAVSIVAVPGGNPKSAWLIVILREYKKGRKFMPTDRTYEHSELEFIVGILAIQPLDIELSLKKYPQNNPIVILVQFPEMKTNMTLQLFDSAIRMLINGYLLPNTNYLSEWRVFLLMMVTQILEEDKESSKKSDTSFLHLYPQ